MAKKPDCISQFERSFNSLEKGYQGIHNALIAGLVHGAANSNSWVYCTRMLQYANSKNPKSLTTVGITHWLQNVAMLNIKGESEKVVASKKGMKYDQEWLDNCKANPWNLEASRLVEKKAPKIPEQSLVTTLARGFALNEFNESEAKAEFAAILAKGMKEKDSPKVKEWVEDYRKQHPEQPTVVVESETVPETEEEQQQTA